MVDLLSLITDIDQNICTDCEFEFATASWIFWSSQLHACSVHDALQTSWDTSNWNHSLSVVEKI